MGCPVVRLLARCSVGNIVTHWWARSATVTVVLLLLKQPSWDAEWWGRQIAVIGLVHGGFSLIELLAFSLLSPEFRARTTFAGALWAGVVLPMCVWILGPVFGGRIAEREFVKATLREYYDPNVWHFTFSGGQSVSYQQQLAMVNGSLVTNSVAVTNLVSQVAQPSFDWPVLIERVERRVQGTNVTYALLPSALNPDRVRTNHYAMHSEFLIPGLDQLAGSGKLPVSRQMLVRVIGERNGSNVKVTRTEKFRGS